MGTYSVNNGVIALIWNGGPNGTYRQRVRLVAGNNQNTRNALEMHGFRRGTVYVPRPWEDPVVNVVKEDSDGLPDAWLN